jgi:hypothetical protein
MPVTLDFDGKVERWVNPMQVLFLQTDNENPEHTQYVTERGVFTLDTPIESATKGLVKEIHQILTGVIQYPSLRGE